MNALFSWNLKDVMMVMWDCYGGERFLSVNNFFCDTYKINTSHHRRLFFIFALTQKAKYLKKIPTKMEKLTSNQLLWRKKNRRFWILHWFHPYIQYKECRQPWKYSKLFFAPLCHSDGNKNNSNELIRDMWVYLGLSKLKVKHD